MGYALVAYEKNIKRYFLITIVDGKEGILINKYKIK